MERAGRKGQEKASTYALVMVTICVAVNIGCGYLAGKLSLPFWLDTIGTMAAAIAFGPAIGGFTGTVSSLLMGLFNLQNLPFVPISIVTGVMIGLLYRRNTANDRLAIVTLAMVNGLVSAVISTLLVSYLYKGYTGNVWGDALQDMLENLVNSSSIPCWQNCSSIFRTV